MALLSIKLLLVGLFVASVLYIHFRGQVKHKFVRQLTDHSTFTAPYNSFVYLCSAVPNRPVIDRDKFPELDLLQQNWETIRDEAVALYEQGGIKKADTYNDLAFNSFFKRGWKRFYFRWYGDYLPSAEKLCPKTTELLKQIPSIHAAMFTLMAPQSRLVKHRDPFGGSLRYHLGLKTPNSDQCRIYIDGEPHAWHDGEDIVFDETYIHRPLNETDEDRIILFCDVERPLKWGWATAINRFVIKHLVKVSQTRNEQGEKVGVFNHAFNLLYRIRLPLKRLKKFNSRIYYALKYVALIALAALIWYLI